jgi:hypothetical protein
MQQQVGVLPITQMNAEENGCARVRLRPRQTCLLNDPPSELTDYTFELVVPTAFFLETACSASAKIKAADDTAPATTNAVL